MRVLNDTSCFTAQEARIFHASNRFVAAECGTGSNLRAVQLPPGLPHSTAVRCTYAGESELTEFFFQRRLRQDFLSVEYVFSGELCIHSGSRGYIAEPGDLCLLHPGMKHDLLFDAATPCRRAGFCLEGPRLSELLALSGLNQVHAVPFADRAAINRMCTGIQRILRRMDAEYAMERNAGWCFEFLQMISGCVRRQAENNAFRQVANYFGDHFHEALDMGTVAARFSVNPEEMNRIFRNRFGLTPYQYLIRLRLNQAAALLRGTSRSIKEIAAMTGYRNPLYFSCEFHRHYGCGPREYRKQNIDKS